MGVGVMQTKNEVFLEQSAYTKALLSRFGIDKANSVATPVDINADPVTTSDEVEECDKDLCQSAVVNAKAKYQKLKPKQRRLIMTYFGAMIEAQGKNELYATFRDFAQLIQSPWIKEDIQTLIEHYKNSETPALDLNFVEPTHALVGKDVGRYRNKCAVGKKFEVDAEGVKKEKYLQGTEGNEYYSLEFMEYVLTYCMPFTPLWCGIQGGTKTNGLVEGWYKIVKSDILQKKRITPSSFVTTMYKQTKARTIESAHDYKIVKKKSTSKTGEDQFVNGGVSVSYALTHRTVQKLERI
ncbi:hypothetical protein FHG87_015058 [Trinorchestia longiramus]|nr:hypothetical protein FHG87_015058 [Trinorchestia longiramus]